MSALRIFISVDIEGVAGIVHPHQGAAGSPEYGEACRLMTLEANAAIEGAIEAGVQEIVVNDSHAQGRNLIAEQLHPVAELVRGSALSPLYMCTGLGPGFDAAFFVGYHGAIGTRDAVIDHSYHGRAVTQVRLNGVAQSEAGLNGAVAGYFNCPVALFTGDAAAVSQMHELVTEVEGVVVKEGITRYSARNLHPSVARERIRSGAKRAIQRLANIPPIRQPGRVELEVDLAYAVMADLCERVPGVERLGARTVAYAADDYLDVFKLFLALTVLAGAAIVEPYR
ncbi:MAG: M55 family metallopeptidase [Candidatus Dormibacteraceae bacterium]